MTNLLQGGGAAHCPPIRGSGRGWRVLIDTFTSHRRIECEREKKSMCDNEEEMMDGYMEDGRMDGWQRLVCFSFCGEMIQPLFCKEMKSFQDECDGQISSSFKEYKDKF